MRRAHLKLARRGFLIGAGLALALTLLVFVSITSFRRPPPAAAPETLERIAARNRDAAANAAAAQRAEAAAATQAANEQAAGNSR